MPTLRQYLFLALLWALVAWLTVGGWTYAVCDPERPARWCEPGMIAGHGRIFAVLKAYYVSRAPIVGAVMGLVAAPALTACTPTLPTIRKTLLQGLIWGAATLATVAHWHTVTEELGAATKAYLPWAAPAGALLGMVAAPVLGAPIERRVRGLAGRALGVAHEAVTAVVVLAVATLALVGLASPKGFASDSYGNFEVKQFVQTWTALLWESDPRVLLLVLVLAATASDRIAHLDADPARRGFSQRTRTLVAATLLQVHHALVGVLVMLAGTTALLRLWPHGNRWETLRMALKWTAMFWSEHWPYFGAVAVLASLISRGIVLRFAARPQDVPSTSETLGEASATPTEA